jgi:serine protease Do
MFCSRCGGQLWPQDLFCPRCGTPVGGGYPPQPAKPAQAPAGGSNRWKYLSGGIAVVAVLAAGAAVTIAVTRKGDGSSGRPVAVSGEATASQPSSTGSSTSPAVSPDSSPGLDFASIYAKQRSGVVRIEVLGCSESGIGTGFLLSPTLIATVNHVVTEPLVVSLTDRGQHTTGHVIGTDPARDLALVRVDSPLRGFHFEFADAPPRVGDPVAAIGFPIGGPITMTQGGVSGLNRSITIPGHQRQTGLIQTDAAVNPGNSGGPLLGMDGHVLGLVDALRLNANGIAYAVPSTQAGPEVTSWQQAPQLAAPATCDNPLGPPQATTTLPSIPGLTTAASDGITSALATYFDGINTGHYRAAWHVLSPQIRGTLTSFAEGDSTSYDFDQAVLEANQIDSTTAGVALEFTSIQASDKGPDGDVCDLWTIDYTMGEAADGRWYIDSTGPYRDRWHTTC